MSLDGVSESGSPVIKKEELRERYEEIEDFVQNKTSP